MITVERSEPTSSSCVRPQATAGRLHGFATGGRRQKKKGQKQVAGADGQTVASSALQQGHTRGSAQKHLAHSLWASELKQGIKKKIVFLDIRKKGQKALWK